MAAKVLSDAGVEKSLRKTRGNMAAVARRHGVKRCTVHEYVHARPHLVQVMRDAKEELVDEAEDALLLAVKERQGWAVCFALKTQGKARGYVESSEAQLRAELEVLRTLLNALQLKLANEHPVLAERGPGADAQSPVAHEGAAQEPVREVRE